MWKLKDLYDYCAKGEIRVNVNGLWLPVRSINYQVRSFREKLKEAWMVYTGKADCFTWPEDDK